MKNLSLNLKFGLMGASIAAVLLVSFALIIVNADRIRVDSANLRQNDIPIMEYAYQMEIAVVQVQQFFSDAGAMRQQDSLQDDLKSAAEYRQRFHALIAKLIALDPRRQDEYRAMQEKFDRYYQAGKDMADAYVNQGTDAGNKLMTGFDSAADSIFEMVNPFVEASQARAHTLLAQQQRSVIHTQWTLFLALLIILGALAAGGAALFRIVRKIPVVSRELNRIAAGDLGGEELIHHSRDEIGQLCSGLNAMRAQLKTIMRELTESSTRIATFANDLSASIGNTENAISRQVSEITQIAAAMHEMSATSHEVAKNATESASAAQQADHEVGAGNHAVEEAIQAIRNAAADIENVSSVIHQVDQSSEEIGTILDVIRGITDQTNLLALNAAIEAARAGEMGRGFAVVADEVRTLAKRTQESTQEIQNMIANLQAAAKKAVQAMKVSQQGVERSVTLAGTSGERLTAISGAVGKITDMTTQIATAAEEQSAVSTEMNENISNISVATEQTGESAHQIAQAGRRMSGLADELQRLVGKFRV